MFDKIRKEAREAIVEALENGYEGYLSELHFHVFNEDYYKIFESDAIAALGNEVFNAISYIFTYEKDNFGEVNTDFTNPCAVANMLWYIIGEEELCSMFKDCPEWDEWWNEEIGETECKALLAWLKDNEKI